MNEDLIKNVYAYFANNSKLLEGKTDGIASGGGNLTVVLENGMTVVAIPINNVSSGKVQVFQQKDNTYYIWQEQQQGVSSVRSIKQRRSKGKPTPLYVYVKSLFRIAQGIYYGAFKPKELLYTIPTGYFGYEIGLRVYSDGTYLGGVSAENNIGYGTWVLLKPTDPKITVINAASFGLGSFPYTSLLWVGGVFGTFIETKETTFDQQGIAVLNGNIIIASIVPDYFYPYADSLHLNGPAPGAYSIWSNSASTHPVQLRFNPQTFVTSLTRTTSGTGYSDQYKHDMSWEASAAQVNNFNFEDFEDFPWDASPFNSVKGSGTVTNTINNTNSATSTREINGLLQTIHAAFNDKVTSTNINKTASNTMTYSVNYSWNSIQEIEKIVYWTVRNSPHILSSVRLYYGTSSLNATCTYNASLTGTHPDSYTSSYTLDIYVTNTKKKTISETITYLFTVSITGGVGGLNLSTTNTTVTGYEPNSSTIALQKTYIATVVMSADFTFTQAHSFSYSKIKTDWKVVLSTGLEDSICAKYIDNHVYAYDYTSSAVDRYTNYGTVSGHDSVYSFVEYIPVSDFGATSTAISRSMQLNFHCSDYTPNVIDSYWLVRESGGDLQLPATESFVVYGSRYTDLSIGSSVVITPNDYRVGNSSGKISLKIPTTHTVTATPDPYHLPVSYTLDLGRLVTSLPGTTIDPIWNNLSGLEVEYVVQEPDETVTIYSGVVTNVAYTDTKDQILPPYFPVLPVYESRTLNSVTITITDKKTVKWHSAMLRISNVAGMLYSKNSCLNYIHMMSQLYGTNTNFIKKDDVYVIYISQAINDPTRLETKHYVDSYVLNTSTGLFTRDVLTTAAHKLLNSTNPNKYTTVVFDGVG